jgi:hypothetical protein
VHALSSPWRYVAVEAALCCSQNVTRRDKHCDACEAFSALGTSALHTGQREVGDGVAAAALGAGAGGEADFSRAISALSSAQRLASSRNSSSV